MHLHETETIYLWYEKRNSKDYLQDLVVRLNQTYIKQSRKLYNIRIFKF